MVDEIKIRDMAYTSAVSVGARCHFDQICAGHPQSTTLSVTLYKTLTEYERVLIENGVLSNDDLRDRNAALRDENARLKAALEPFAKFSVALDASSPGCADNSVEYVIIGDEQVLTRGDLRRAVKELEADNAKD